MPASISVVSLIEEPFGQFVKALRQEFGLSQIDAANAFGVSQATVCCWEKGTQAPNLDTLKVGRELLRRYKSLRADGDRKTVGVADGFSQTETTVPSSATLSSGGGDIADVEVTAEGFFLTAVDVFAEAIKAHRASLTQATSDIVGLARQGLIEAHLAGAQVRAVGLTEATRAQISASEDVDRLLDLEQFLAFVSEWAWRQHVTEAERLSAIRFHPLVKLTASSADRKSVGATDEFPQSETEGQASGDAEAAAMRERVARAIFNAVRSHTDVFHPAFEHDQEIWFEAADEALAAFDPASVHVLKPAAVGKTTDMLRTVDVDRARSLAARLSRDLQTAINDDRSVPGTEEPRRFATRCATMLDTMDFLRGLVGTSAGGIAAARAE